MSKPFPAAKPKETCSIEKGEIIAFFAFEIGASVCLETLSALIQSAPKTLSAHKKQTPKYIQYSQKPQVLELGQCDLLPTISADVQATVFHFGTISIAYHWHLEPGTLLSQLPALSEQIYFLDLELNARQYVKSLLEKIKSAISRPILSELTEDYYVFVLKQLNQPSLNTEQLLRQHSAVFAQTLQFDTKTLSQAQQEKTLSKVLSYYPTDLLIVDWNASIIYDTDYIDTLSVLELLNAELLEARFMDAQLDEKIQTFDSSHIPSRWLVPFFIPYRQTVKELASFKIEASLLTERVDNALKLIGDQYLSRVYSMVSKQFYLPTWDASISRKLTIIDDLYQVLTDRVNIAQSQLLELIIILLILTEIVLSLLKVRG